MKTVIWLIIVAVIILGSIPIITFIVNFVFIDKVAERKVNASKEIVSQSAKVHIEELPNKKGQVISLKNNTFYQQDEAELMLTPAGVLTDDPQSFDNDGSHNVLPLTLANSNTNSYTKFIFQGSTVYEQAGNRIGRTIHTFNKPTMQSIRYVSNINNGIILMAADPDTHSYVDTKLWQVDIQSFEKTLLSEKPYYTFELAPKVLSPEGYNGVIVIYYSGGISYGYGGDVSRPELSTVRLYSDTYPQGHDLVSFHYKAGTIIDVSVAGDKLIFTGDPSRPTSIDNHERPARFWQVTLL